jgi:nucleoside-diphosphate-sugar epimerase
VSATQNRTVGIGWELALRVAVTGASGRIGRAIYVRLGREHDVIGLDRVPSSTADVVGDLADEQALARLLDGVDAVVHVAAMHAPHVGLVADAEFERINVQATDRLLDACLKRGVRRFVLTSTTALYGDAVPAAGAAVWLDEATEPQPRTIYHRSKLQAERLVAAAGGGGSMRTAAIRMSRCFPEPANRMAAYRLHRGVDARDVASAHQWVLERLAGGHRIWLVSGATPFRREDLDRLGRDPAGVLALRQPGFVEDMRRRGWALPSRIDRVCDPGALMRQGWQPRHGHEEVLRQFDEESSEVLMPASA